MSEKRKASYDLRSVRAWSASSKFSVTGLAARSAAALGFGASAMASVMQRLQTKHFIKSMTSYHNHREWQDVYHVPSEVGVLYVKFRADAVTEFLLLSFKERDDG